MALDVLPDNHTDFDPDSLSLKISV
jgi:hypothetical protein